VTVVASRSAVHDVDVGCTDCGFQLWLPIATMRVSRLGLFDDGRFPGRCLLSLNPHFEDFSTLPQDLLAAFLEDMRDASLAMRQVTASPRVNYAVLGNTEPHVHCHLVPRYPDREAKPLETPWDDPRAWMGLAVEVKVRLRRDIAARLAVVRSTTDSGEDISSAH